MNLRTINGACPAATRLVSAAVAGFLLSAGTAAAQFTYPGCDPLKPADFRISEIFNKNGQNAAGAVDGTLNEPVQMDLKAVRKGANGDSLSHVDIYFVERLGAVKRYDGAAKKVSLLGNIPTWGKIDNGLMGLALHPDFDRNRWIYFWVCPNKLVGQNRLLRLIRLTVTADWKLDMASEKILIEILGSKSDAYHSGGPMTFDAHGDLWITVGNNSPDLDPETLNVLSPTDSTHSAEWGPSNTANMRGSILRIHPDSSLKGYGIPKGNFGQFWAGEFERQGRGDLASQYRDPTKVLPEIYVKGNRSNYSLSVHPTKGWLSWGEINFSNAFDELNLVANPVFAGYPYFHAANLATGKHGKNSGSPVNLSPLNSGVSNLPPAVPGMVNNLQNVIISGPMYVYDRALPSKVKFPPHLHNTWFSTSHASGYLYIHTLDTLAVKVATSTRVDNQLISTRLRRPLQARFGPDGALYFLNYDGHYNTINPGVTLVEYVGACRLPVVAVREPLPGPALDVAVASGALWVGEAGAHAVTLHDPSGRLRGRLDGGKPARYALRDLQLSWGLEGGIYLARVSTSRGAATRTVSLLP